jgi:GNAT superfamily N-acetyltransferase
MTSDFWNLKTNSRNKAVGGLEHFYILYLGTAEDSRGKGLCSQLVRHYQEIAENAQLPIWIEAGTEYSMRLYLKLGFELFEELRYAVGTSDENGRDLEGGKGVTIWGMVWKPGVVCGSPGRDEETRVFTKACGFQ